MADVIKTIDAGGVTHGVEHFGDAAARLLVIEDAATAIPDAATGEVAAAMLSL